MLSIFCLALCFSAQAFSHPLLDFSGTKVKRYDQNRIARKYIRRCPNGFDDGVAFKVVQYRYEEEIMHGIVEHYVTLVKPGFTLQINLSKADSSNGGYGAFFTIWWDRVDGCIR